MFAAVTSLRCNKRSYNTATTTWPHLAIFFCNIAGVVFKSLAMVAIVANTVYLGWAADHNDSWYEGLHRCRISVYIDKRSKTL